MSDRAASKKLKKLWKTTGKGFGLREFATSLAKSEDTAALVTRWFENKKGACNQGRSPANITRATLEGAATRAARTKASKGKQQ